MHDNGPKESNTPLLPRLLLAVREGTVANRLAFGFGALLLLLIVSGLVSYSQICRIDNDLDQIVEIEGPLEQAVLEMEINSIETARAILNYVIEPNDRFIKQVHESESRFEHYATNFGALAETDDERRAGEKVFALYSNIVSLGDDLMETVQQQRQSLKRLRWDVAQIDQLIKLDMNRNVDRTASDARQLVEQLLKMEIQIEVAFAAVEGYVAHRSPDHKTELQAAFESFQRIEESHRMAHQVSEPERQILSRLDDAFEQAVSDSHEILVLTDRLHDTRQTFQSKLEQMDGFLEHDVQDMIQRETIAATTDARSSTRTVLILISIIITVGVCLGIAISWRVSRRIVYGIHKLVQGSEIIASGNRGHRIDLAKNDEFGQIALAFNRTVDCLNRTSDELLSSEREAQRARAEAAKQEIERHAAEARTDALTQLPNRRAFDDEMARCAAEFERNGRSAVIAVIDVDHFKMFNDTHGHQAGDEVLRGVARVLENSTRETEMVTRYGGEEFAIVIPGSSIADGAIVAQRTCRAIEQAVFHFEGTDLQVTVSEGLAELRRGECASKTFERADKALYASKEAGRNCVHIHDGQHVHPATETVEIGM